MAKFICNTQSFLFLQFTWCYIDILEYLDSLPFLLKYYGLIRLKTKLMETIFLSDTKKQNTIKKKLELDYRIPSP